MERAINVLIGYRMEATEGEIGKVEEFYFDDDSWTIRYLVLKTVNWFSGRRVLIAPNALVKGSWNSGLFLVNLSKDQILKSPDIDTDKPVCRQQEIDLYGYYGWQGYWEGGFYGEGSPERRGEVDLHLRSSRQVTGYHLHGTDGEIGHVADFLMDDQTWQITHLIADISNRVNVKNVLVAVGDIKKMLWSDSEIYVDLTKDAIRKGEMFHANV